MNFTFIFQYAHSKRGANPSQDWLSHLASQLAGSCDATRRLVECGRSSATSSGTLSAIRIRFAVELLRVLAGPVSKAERSTPSTSRLTEQALALTRVRRPLHEATYTFANGSPFASRPKMTSLLLCCLPTAQAGRRHARRDPLRTRDRRLLRSCTP